MHIVERIRLDDPDTLAVELTITAPKVLAEAWTTTRLFVRRRGPQFAIVEGQCVQGELVEAVDEHGKQSSSTRRRPTTAACRWCAELASSARRAFA
jgi:hypothetical protein